MGNNFNDMDEDVYVVKNTNIPKTSGSLIGPNGRMSIPLQLLIIAGAFVVAIIGVFIYYKSKEVVKGGCDSVEACIDTYVKSVNENDVDTYFELFPAAIRNTALHNYADCEDSLGELSLMKIKMSNQKVTDKEVLNETQMQHIESEIKHFSNKKVDVTEAYMVTWTCSTYVNVFGVENTAKEKHVFTVVKIKDKYFVYGIKDYEW